jgi:hypothetical protein
MTVKCKLCGAELKSRQALPMHLYHRHRQELDKYSDTGELSLKPDAPAAPAAKAPEKETQKAAKTGGDVPAPAKAAEAPKRKFRFLRD